MRRRLTAASLIVFLGVAGIVLALAQPAGAATHAAARPAPAGQVSARPAAHGWRHPARPRAAGSYTIRPGDTLGKIAAARCGTWAAYPALAAGNGIANPDLIYAGRTLALTCHHGYSSARSVHRAYSGGHYKGWRAPDGRVWMVTYGFPFKCGDGDRSGWDMPCSQLHRYAARAARAGAAYHGPVTYRHHHHYTSGGSYHGVAGSYEACVIARESGGDSQVMNSSQHWGLYQFSKSTWEAYGGSSSSFGSAGSAEQHRVFANAMAQGGQSNWSPYDGC